jgi:hypothetical protein
LEVKTCGEVGAFYRALKGHGLSSKGGGTLFTSDGAFNSAGCMQSLFAPGSSGGQKNFTNHSSGNHSGGGGGGGALVESGSTAIGFYTDFSSMGEVAGIARMADAKSGRVSARGAVLLAAHLDRAAITVRTVMRLARRAADQDVTQQSR